MSDDREEFEKWYIRHMEAEGMKPVSLDRMKEMRQPENYGASRAYLNGCWHGYQAARSQGVEVEHWKAKAQRYEAIVDDRLMDGDTADATGAADAYFQIADLLGVESGGSVIETVTDIVENACPDCRGTGREITGGDPAWPCRTCRGAESQKSSDSDLTTLLSDIDEYLANEPGPGEGGSEFADHLRSRIKALLQTQPPSCGVPEVFADLLTELDKAMTKFPAWPTDPLHALGVVNEEVGELQKAVLQAVYEPEKNPLGAVEKEALQAAAMCLRFIASLGQYRYAGCEQHSQPSLSIPNHPSGEWVRCDDVEAIARQMDQYDVRADVCGGAYICKSFASALRRLMPQPPKDNMQEDSADE